MTSQRSTYTKKKVTAEKVKMLEYHHHENREGDPTRPRRYIKVERWIFITKYGTFV